MIVKMLAAFEAGEVLIIGAVIAVGVQLDSLAIVAFGAVWYVPVLVDRIRRRR